MNQIQNVIQETEVGDGKILLIGGLCADVAVCECGPDEVYIAYIKDENTVSLTAVDKHGRKQSVAVLTINNLRELMALCASMLTIIEPKEKLGLN